jgi:hypothetical protein
MTKDNGAERSKIFYICLLERRFSNSLYDYFNIFCRNLLHISDDFFFFNLKKKMAVEVTKKKKIQQSEKFITLTGMDLQWKHNAMSLLLLKRKKREKYR